jgi:hypothetical protein
MSFFADLKRRLLGESKASSQALSGVWRVIDISVPHPFGKYILHLRPDGSLEWSSVVSTTDAGELNVEGSGTWRASGRELHYTSGSSAGKVLFTLEGSALVLDGLPATKIGPGARCVFVRT